ncbi:MAG: oxidoreductase [Nakamurella sp.]
MANSQWTDLGGLPGVSDAVEGCRVAITALRRHPANRKGWPRTAAAASIRAARASAALDGAPLILEQGVAAVTEPILAGALRAGSAIGAMAGVWPRSPLQVLARLHTLAAADLVPPDELGRPRMDDATIGPALAGLAELVTNNPWPAPVQVAVVHGELLGLAPFGSANGVVARAAARLTMIATGLDPAGLGVPEAAHLRSGERYRDLAEGFAAGGLDGVDDWILEVCRCLVAGVREGVSIADGALESDR